MIVFIEETPLGAADSVSKYRRVYNTLKNIASHYDIPVALYVQDYVMPNVARFLDLRMDVYILGPSATSDLPPLSEVWNLGNDALGVALSVPIDNFERGKDFIEKALALHKTEEKHKFFFTSYGPVTRDVDLETMRQLRDEVSQNRF
jgi:hypothetical protein